MAMNYMQSGKVLTPTLTTAAQSGELVFVGELAGVCLANIPAGGSGAVAVCGVYRLPKAAEAFSVGAKVFLDAGTKKLTATESGNTPVGLAAEDAASGVSTLGVLLNGLPA